MSTATLDTDPPAVSAYPWRIPEGRMAAAAEARDRALKAMAGRGQSLPLNRMTAERRAAADAASAEFRAARQTLVAGLAERGGYWEYKGVQYRLTRHGDGLTTFDPAYRSTYYETLKAAENRELDALNARRFGERSHA
jgi:hypothetical protein